MANFSEEEEFDKILALKKGKKFDEAFVLARQLCRKPGVTPYFRIQAAVAMVETTKYFTEASQTLQAAERIFERHVDEFRQPNDDELYQYIRWQLKRCDLYLQREARAHRDPYSGEDEDQNEIEDGDDDGDEVQYKDEVEIEQESSSQCRATSSQHEPGFLQQHGSASSQHTNLLILPHRAKKDLQPSLLKNDGSQQEPSESTGARNPLSKMSDEGLLSEG